MKVIAVLLPLFAAGVVYGAILRLPQEPLPHECATCYGLTPCKACTSCNYCKHCKVLGGKCGACR